MLDEEKPSGSPNVVRLLGIKLFLSVGFILVLGGLQIHWQGRTMDLELRQRLLSQAIAITQTISVSEIKALSFSAVDNSKPEYQRLSRVMNAYAHWAGIRSIHTFVQKDAELVFGPSSHKTHDSEVPGRKKHYRQLRNDIQAVFHTQLPVVLGPFVDETESLISAFAPVLDPGTNRVEMVIGVDRTALDHRRIIRQSQRVSIVYTLVIAGALVLGFAGLWLRQRRGLERRWFFQNLETIATASVTLILSLALTHLTHLREQRSRSAIFRQMSEAELGSVVTTLGRVRDDRLTNLAQHLRLSKALSQNAFLEIAIQIIARGEVGALGWAPEVPAADLAQFEIDRLKEQETPFRVFELDSKNQRVSPGKRLTYYPILYSAPLDVYQKVQGFDLGSEPHRQAAILESLRTGLPTATDAVLSVNGWKSSVFFHPVKEPGSQTLGFVLGVVDFENLLHRALLSTGHQNPMGRLELFQLDPNLAPVLVAARERNDLPADFQEITLKNEGEFAQAPIFVFGKPFGVRVSSGLRMEGAIGSNDRVPIALACLMFSLVLTLAVWNVSRQRMNLESQIKRRTKELAESEDAYRRQFQDNSEIMLIVDPPTMRILEANRAAVRCYGYSREKLLSLRVYDLVSDPPENIHKITTDVERDGAARFEARHRWASGEVREVEVSVSLVPLQARRVHHVLVVDITARKEAETSLVTTNQRLESATALANDLALEAASANSAKSEFLANMSHEIRTPLNAIVGMTGLLLDTQVTHEQQRYLQILRSSGQALLVLVNDILDLSKIEAGKLTLESLDFQLRDLLDDLIEILAIKAHGKGLKLSCIVDPEVPLSLCGDAARLRQVLLNLGDNAIKFCQAGDIIVRVRRNKMEGTSVELCFSVIDTGIGIPSDKVANLFQPFTQVDSTTTRKYGGTGLGLVICQKLVALMGGSIQVTSEEGQGSTFTFTARMTTTKQAVVQGDTMDGLFASIAVLVADPHQPTRESIVSILTTLGCSISQAWDAASVQRLMDEGQRVGDSFQVVFTDPEFLGTDLRPFLSKFWKTQPPFLVEVKSLGCVATLTRAGFSAQLTIPARASAIRELVLQAAGIDRLVPIASNSELDSWTKKRGQLGQRILVVEDNRTNQIVTTGILEKLGYSVAVADDGIRALAILAEKPFDLVLMDCQMPEMDGFETTRQIRASGRTYANVTIVALTAYSQAEDRRRCFDAGMNDYISKPVHPTELAQVLRKWFNGTVPTRPTPPRERVVDQAIWNREELTRRVMGDENLVQQILTVFLSDLPKTMDEIQASIRNSDLSRTAQFAHRLKGACLNISASRLAKAAKDLEMAGKAGDEVQVQAIFPQLFAEASVLRIQVESEEASQVSSL